MHFHVPVTKLCCCVCVITCCSLRCFHLPPLVLSPLNTCTMMESLFPPSALLFMKHIGDVSSLCCCKRTKRRRRYGNLFLRAPWGSRLWRFHTAPPARWRPGGLKEPHNPAGTSCCFSSCRGEKKTNVFVVNDSPRL